MTRNRDTETAWRYHEYTKHSYHSIRADRHYLDWSNRPSPFKIYPTIDPIQLPVEFAWTGARALEVVAASGVERSAEIKPTLDRLASLLLYSVGVTKEKKYPGGSFYFRAAACAGALYPIETYVVCGDIDGLEAGVYHFNPGDFSLRRLREGDHRGTLIEATARARAICSAPVILVYSAISFRSSWKYRDRAYRYHFWDNGMILANALAMAAANGLPAEVVLGFVEPSVNQLIGIDGESELALSLFAIGHSNASTSVPRIAESPPELDYEVIPLSPAPVDYPSIREMHCASSLTNEDVATWRESAFVQSEQNAGDNLISLSPYGDNELAEASIEEVIERRGSTRRFARKPISLAELSTILERSTHEIPTDCLDASAHLNDLYLIVNRVDGLEPGAYFYRRSARELELLRPGDFSRNASYLTLEQDLGGDASATIFFMADLPAILASFGNRGYRASEMEAGIIGGKMYLTAYALRRGATGLTFYDDDVTEFFSPHAAAKSCMLVVSIGVAGKRLIF